jgi:hypothetical protein
LLKFAFNEKLTFFYISNQQTTDFCIKYNFVLHIILFQVQFCFFFFQQRLLATLCCLLLASNVCLSQKEISIGDLLEEAKIDANDLLKEVDTSKEKASQIPKEEKKETADADEPVSTPRPRLFKPKQGRPAFQKILQQKLQDQQKSESLLVNNNPEQSEGQVAPPRKRFRPTSAPAPVSRF